MAIRLISDENRGLREGRIERDRGVKRKKNPTVRPQQTKACANAIKYPSDTQLEFGQDEERFD